MRHLLFQFYPVSEDPVRNVEYYVYWNEDSVLAYDIEVDAYSHADGQWLQPQSFMEDHDMVGMHTFAVGADGNRVRFTGISDHPYAEFSGLDDISLTITDEGHVNVKGGNDGYVTLSANGSNPPFTYSMDGYTYTSSQTFSGLSAGTYTFYAKDSNGFNRYVDKTIYEPSVSDDMVFSLVSHVPPSTKGGSDGYVSMAVTGSNSPFRVKLSGNNGVTRPWQSQFSFSNLPEGTYTITAEDSALYTRNLFVTLSVDASCDLIITSPPAVTQLSQLGGSDGAVSVFATSSNTPLTYSLVNNTTSQTRAKQSSSTFNNLGAGAWSYFVEDWVGCTASGTFNVAYEPPACDLILTDITVRDVITTTEEIPSGSITVAAVSQDMITYQLMQGNSVLYGWSIANRWDNLSIGVYRVQLRTHDTCLIERTVYVSSSEGKRYLQVDLSQSMNDIGYLHTTEDVSSEANTHPQFSVTGTTESKLELVRSYSLSTPYIVGVNGVVSVSPESVVYEIDGIQYTTILEDGTTTYAFGAVGLNSDNSISQHVVKRPFDVFTERHKTLDDLEITRGEISVFESMYRIANINSIDDFKNLL